jgi:hypothetical protein
LKCITIGCSLGVFLWGQGSHLQGFYAYYLITPQKPHLQIPSHRGLDLSAWTWENTNSQFVTLPFPWPLSPQGFTLDVTFQLPEAGFHDFFLSPIARGSIPMQFSQSLSSSPNYNHHYNWVCLTHHQPSVFNTI